MKRIAIAALLAAAGTSHAATIYLCKAYNGSTFWAKSHCNQHNAFIERIDTVPDGMPWDRQVQQAEQALKSTSQRAAANDGEQQRLQRCGTLIAERNKIESRYTNWQWQPPEVINPDQQRMRALRSELSANRCGTQ